jgi:hypothetical protein
MKTAQKLIVGSLVLCWVFAVGCTRVQVAKASVQHTINVPGNRQWAQTGIRVKKGERISLSASGTISNNPQDTGRDPDGSSTQFQNETRDWNPLPEANDLSLIGRVGRILFAVGRSRDIQIPADGELELGVNDNNVNDNEGSWEVLITPQPSREE